MRKPILKYNSIDFDENLHDPLSCLKYKGEWFTGTLLSDDNRSYTEYTDGDVDGKCIEYYQDGQIEGDYVYDKGKCISEKTWYPNGILRSDGIHLFDINGKLIRENGSWLYPNGTKRNTRSKGEHYEFSPKGELAIKTIVNMSGDYKNTIVYYDNILVEYFEELFINYYPEEDQLFYNLEYKLWGWVMTKYNVDKNQGLELFRKLANFSNTKISENAQLLMPKLESGEIIPENYISNLSYHVVMQ